MTTLRCGVLLGGLLLGTALFSVTTGAGHDDERAPGGTPEACSSGDVGGALQAGLDQALELLASGNPGTAKNVFSSLAGRMPPGWQARRDAGTSVCRAYWTASEFRNCVAPDQKSDKKRVEWQRPSWAHVYFLLGYLALDERDAPAAVDYLGTALKLDPTHPQIYYERGQAYLVLRDFDRALNHFRLAASIRPCALPDPVHAAALANQGVILLELNRLDEAEAALEAALKIAPTYTKASAELLYLYTLRAGGPRRELKGF